MKVDDKRRKGHRTRREICIFTLCISPQMDCTNLRETIQSCNEAATIPKIKLMHLFCMERNALCVCVLFSAALRA